MPMPVDLPDDIAALKAMIRERDAIIATHATEIEQLKLLIAKLKRMQFGRKSEKLDHQIEQLELRLEDLQADAYAGFNAIYASGKVQEAACCAHARRKFYDLHDARPSAVTTEALRRIGELYVIEAEIRGKPPDERLLARYTRSRPLLDALETWLRTTMATLSRKSDTTAAILYALNRWPALTRYCDDGVIEIDNSAAERALRGVTMGRSLCTSF